MDQSIRNKLRGVVTQCRKLLEEAVSQVLQGQFGIYASGKKDSVHVEDESRMKNLSEEDKVYRRDIQANLEHIEAIGYKAKDALAQLVREIAFTHLNRLCAYKMMEAREVWVGGQRFRESVSRGMKSQGFQFYLADHPEDKQQFDTGYQDVAYRRFLGWLGAQLSEEIGVLFSPNDPANRLFPPQRVLDDVLALLNNDDLKAIWTEDETIGWVYQYFTPKELRDQVRKESSAPRNSYELAFRNQFFTPRYVVEFLTDNTLGRIWYEMRKGDTKLKDQCRYMVRRPTEVFLTEGQTPPEPSQNQDELPQDELLKQPVYIPYRPKKDPRELRILDPACGSGHFLLYCFDLLLTIYEEAYADPDLGPKLREDYPTLEALRRDVPRLILAHNLHGIDIDLRCTQIAALALWLRCQRAYREIGLKHDRPKITKSNIACAEPMPGENEMLKEFVAELQPKLLGHLVEIVFDKMKLAGEAGSLLKIEEELRDAIANAKQRWVAEHEQAKDRKGRSLLFSRAEMERLANKTPQPQLFEFSEITDGQFWNEAETQVLAALRGYAAHASNGRKLQRQLFAEDAAQGFAFVDLCQKRFDVVLMNPPFGKGSTASDAYLRQTYTETWKDLYAALLERCIAGFARNGFVGCITSSLFMYTKQLRDLRFVWTKNKNLFCLIELGAEVLDTAAVETALTVTIPYSTDSTLFSDLTQRDDKQASLAEVSRLTPTFSVTHSLSRFENLYASPLCYHMADAKLRLWEEPDRLEPIFATVALGNHTFDDERFLRLRWEVRSSSIGYRWFGYEKGGEYQPYYCSTSLLYNWENDGEEARAFQIDRNGSDAQVLQSKSLWWKAGITYPRVTSVGFGPRAMPPGHIFASESISIFSDDDADRLPLLAFLCSSWAEDLIQAFGRYRKIENRAVANLPLQRNGFEASKLTLGRLGRRGVGLVMLSESWDETSPLFTLPERIIPARHGEGNESHATDRATTANALEELAAETDRVVGKMLFGNTLPECSASFRGEFISRFVYPNGKDDSTAAIRREWLSYAVGAAFGRWDVRIAAGEHEAPNTPEPFSRLSVCSPGMLQGQDGLPAKDTPKGYPLCIDWDGIIPDDPDHSDDIVRRVREVLELIWKDRAEAVEKEACEILGVTELRDYFRKPGKGGFWDNHVSRYSKSRRKAPIYWILQSSKKNYALWLYYHRLDKDMLFKARQNYVEPKIRLEQSRLDSLRSQKTSLGAAAKGAKKIDKDIERQEILLGELNDFAEKLERAAKLNFGNPEKLNSDVIYDPDLNDGVVLNIAPLWELVPWKEAKNYWEELLEGKYEWSSMGKLLRKKGLVK